MKIAVLADDSQWMEMQSFINAHWVRTADEKEFLNTTTASVYINLLDNAASMDYSMLSQPVLINSVNTTLKEINAGSNIVRINSWPTFLNRTTWEISGQLSDEVKIFALQDKVSTKSEIDIAMKMGTNYPYGPFEWSEKIGLKNIASLLKKLTTGNKRYIPSLLLLQETETNAHNLKY